MANPTWPNTAEGSWTKVATNVTTGTINRLESKYKYYATYKLTGEAAPADAIKLKSPVIFQDSNTEEISSSAAIDVYIWLEDSTSSGATGIANSIQVNI